MKRIIPVGLLALALVGCATTQAPPRSGVCTLTIESEPSQAHILFSEDEAGPWQDFYKERGLHVTPSSVPLRKGDFFWIKLQKDGYRDSEPYFVRATPGKDIALRLKLGTGDTATVHINSEPGDGAEVLVAESMDGDYRPWPGAEGEAITPAHGQVPVGDAFWVKGRRKEGKKLIETEAQYVYVESADPLYCTLDFSAETPKQKLVVTSDPPGATVLVASAEFGRYEPWPPEKQLQVTPMEVMVGVGQQFWLKMRKDQYETTRPQMVTMEADQPTVIHAVLRPEAVSPGRQQQLGPAKESAREPGGIIANGYALVRGAPGQARNAAILDALGVAIQEKYGAQVTARSIANNYLLMQHRIESLAEGRFVDYDVLQESQEDGIYHVILRVRFQDDLLKAIEGENVSFTVGGHERVYVGDRPFPGISARRAVADALMESSMRTVVIEPPVGSPKELARRAQENQTDLALYLAVIGELRDKLGQFYSYKTDIDYQLVMPVTGDIVADGRVEGVNEKRQLTVKDAAIHSLRDVGEKVAAEVIQKLAARYDRAASYVVYVKGVQGQRQIETLVNELGTIAAVRDARLMASEGDICEIALTITPSARPAIAGAVQRLRNVDLDVLEADLYTALAQVR